MGSLLVLLLSREIFLLQFLQEKVVKRKWWAGDEILGKYLRLRLSHVREMLFLKRKGTTKMGTFVLSLNRAGA